ncbi:MAG: RluA family pseudouridine synthase [Myxococcota bacterium]
MSQDETSDAASDSAEDVEAIAFVVDEALAGTRVDAALAGHSGVSRSQVRRWLDAGRVCVEGEVVRASRILDEGERVEAEPLVVAQMDLQPEAIPLVVLFEDADLIVIDKQAGLVVHPAPGHPSGTLVNALLHHCAGQLSGIGGVARPGIVHRLDRGTSGVMVAAKSDAAHQGLSAQFAEHTIERRYHTFVRGLPRVEEGQVDRPIGRHPRDRKRMSVETRAGRPSVTNWQLLRRYPESGVSELSIRPETGRTHQIRVHLASAGLPMVGDVVYGRARGKEAELGRPALHAARLGFQHPLSGDWLDFEAPLPSDLQALVEGLGPAVEATDEADA